MPLVQELIMKQLQDSIGTNKIENMMKDFVEEVAIIKSAQRYWFKVEHKYII